MRHGLVEPSGRPDPRRYSKASLIAVIAASEAWNDAGLRINEPGAGVLVGSGAGGIDVAEKQYDEYFLEAGRRVTPYAIPVSIVGMISSEISIALGLHGISHVISTGCTSSTDAIGYATALIRSGEADVLLTGGADACVTPGMIFGFSKMRAVATRYNDYGAEASRPFEKSRDGFVLGEGAWMLVLEREDRALARGARVYATVDGYGSTCDAYHRVQMDPQGEQIVRAMSLAVERSGRAKEDDRLRQLPRHVDGAERRRRGALRPRVLRPAADRVAGSSTKSMIGHPQGASGAAGIVTAALAMRDGVPAADDQPRRAGSAVRRRRHSQCRPRGVGRRPRCATASGSARRTAPSCSAMHDVVIAGAGPAGAIAALVLARAGVKVALFDRARFPRPKLCGDSINPGALAILRRLDLSHVTEGGLLLDGMLVSGEGGVRVSGTLRWWADRDRAPPRCAGRASGRSGRGRGCRRRRERPGAGAGAVGGPRQCHRSGDRRQPTASSVRRLARVTIAADGRQSRVARALRLSHTPRRPRRWAVGSVFRGVTGLSPLGEMHVRRRCYLGIAPLPDGTANACVVTSDTELLKDPDLLPRMLRQDGEVGSPLCPRRDAGGAHRPRPAGRGRRRSRDPGPAARR